MPPKLKEAAVNKDDLYMKIWEIEQKHITTRWTVSTFFFGISFAIFGFSLKTENIALPLCVTISVAIAIYWFTYALYLRFNDYTSYLRSRLEEMEKDGSTSLDIQSKAKPYLNRKKRPTATQLIGFFGLIYTIAGVAISLLFQS